MTGNSNPFERKLDARLWLAQEVGRRLRAAREAGGWSQQEVADDVGITRSHIANLEAGRRLLPSLESLYELAASLCVNPKDLLP